MRFLHLILLGWKRNVFAETLVHYKKLINSQYFSMLVEYQPISNA